jgi:mRNA interferase MazF
LIGITLRTPPEAEQDDWGRLSVQGLSAAYSEHEPEYPVSLIKEPNQPMKESDIVLTPVPQANGQVKNRPALMLRKMPPFDDVLVCGLSTQLHQKVAGFDEIITQQDADFATSGLVTDSLIRLGFLAVLPQNRVIGSIGSIAPERHKRLLQNLSDYLLESTQE